MSAQFPLDLLIDHVDGLLDEATSSRIEKQRSNDPDLDATLKGISLFLADHSNNREELEKWLQQTDTLSLESTQLKGEQPTSFFSTPSRAWLMAAAVLGLVALLWISVQPNANDYLTEQSAVHYSLPTYRSDEVSPATEALQEYASKNYESAQKLLMAMSPQDHDPLSMMALGMSSFHLGDHAQAIEILQSEIVQNSTLADQANWFSALAAWHLKECEEAEEYLNKVKVPSADQDVTKTRKILQESASCSQ